MKSTVNAALLVDLLHVPSHSVDCETGFVCDLFDARPMGQIGGDADLRGAEVEIAERVDLKRHAAAKPIDRVLSECHYLRLIRRRSSRSGRASP